jgi:ABC-type lipoprotein export system ATPase subunit
MSGIARDIISRPRQRDAGPPEVSGGERRRASLARCLVSAPQAIFADEPTSNLDSKNAFMVADLLIALASSGLAVVMTTHDPLVARRFRLRADIRDGCLSADPGASADATNCLKMVPR